MSTAKAATNAIGFSEDTCKGDVVCSFARFGSSMYAYYTIILNYDIMAGVVDVT